MVLHSICLWIWLDAASLNFRVDAVSGADPRQAGEPEKATHNFITGTPPNERTIRWQH